MANVATSARIRKLSNEAAEHGDLDMVAICERALAGDADALRECERVLAEAEAHQGRDPGVPPRALLGGRVSAECLGSAAHWDALAVEALRMAEWNDAHIGSGAAQRHKAESYKRTAQALRIEAETGVPHCSCCMKPMGRPSGAGALHGARR